METIAEPKPEAGTGQGDKPDKKRGQRRTNYALAGVLLASGLTYAEAAAKTGAGNGDSLRRGLARKGVTKKLVRDCPISDERVLSATARVSVAGAEMIRDRLAGQLGQSVSSLETVPVEYPDLASKGQGRAAVLKTLAETHKLLFGGSESTVLVFGVDQIAERALEPVVDVTSTVEPVRD